MMNFFAEHRRIRMLSACAAVFGMLNGSVMPAFAQAPGEVSETAAAPGPALSQGQLQQLVAPIALYPDSLLTHVLMGATYPFEIVQAARWRDGNPNVTGPDLEQAMQEQPWDESVKALTAFPQVLTMMNEKLDWTQQLGEAFLADQQAVFAAVQALRQRAETAGNLKTSKELRVTRTARDDGSYYTVIDTPQPDEIYVPVYDPTIVYGAWPYDDYPPYYWYPRGWRRDRLFWFGTAIVLGTALWAVWNWRSRSLAVDARRFNAFNRTKLANPTWAFKAQHRKGVPFKSPVLAKKLGPIAAPTNAQRAILHNQLKKGTLSKVTPVTPTVKSTTPHTTTPHTTTPLTKHHSATGGTTGTPHKTTTAVPHKVPVPKKTVTAVPHKSGGVTHKAPPKPQAKVVPKVSSKPAVKAVAPVKKRSDHK